MSLVFSHDGLNYEIVVEDNSIKSLYCEEIDARQYLERASRENIAKVMTVFDLMISVLQSRAERGV